MFLVVRPHRATLLSYYSPSRSLPLILHSSTPSSFTPPPPLPSPLHPLHPLSPLHLFPPSPPLILILHPSTPHSPPPPCLQIRRHCVSQVDTAGQNLADYEYKDVEYMAKVHAHSGQRLNGGVNKTPSHFTFHSGGRWGGDNLDPSICPNSILQVYYRLWFSQTPVEAVRGLLPLSLLFLYETC